MHYVYILKSLKDFKNYVGMTSDLKRRIAAHNWGEVSSTKSRRPFELIYVEEFESKKDAERRERYFKTGNGRETLKICLKEYAR